MKRTLPIIDPVEGRADHAARPDRGPWAVFVAFLRLGFTSFGGPIAHLGFFRSEFVTRRAWLSEQGYADLVALCQILPGPASSQVGMAIGHARAGYAGALAAWAGFTLPSAVGLILLARGLADHGALVPPGALHGLKIVAVAVVAQAVWGMARTLCTDATRITITTLAAVVVSYAPTAWAQVGTIAVAGVVGVVLLRPGRTIGDEAFPIIIGRGAGFAWLASFVVLLVGLPLLAGALPGRSVAMIDAFYRSGALVFGGGHVVLPLLQSEVVPRGWVDEDTFLAGYGATQAVPGPLFTFAAFLGASMHRAPSGLAGGLIGLLSIFAPSFLLVMGALPFWGALRGNPRARAALGGINAAVVGLLVAALYRPVWTSAIHAPGDLALALAALAALVFWKVPPWLVVVACGTAGWVFP